MMEQTKEIINELIADNGVKALLDQYLQFIDSEKDPLEASNRIKVMIDAVMNLGLEIRIERALVDTLYLLDEKIRKERIEDNTAIHTYLNKCREVMLCPIAPYPNFTMEQFADRVKEVKRQYDLTRLDITIINAFFEEVLQLGYSYLLTLKKEGSNGDK